MSPAANLSLGDKAWFLWLHTYYVLKHGTALSSSSNFVNIQRDEDTWLRPAGVHVKLYAHTYRWEHVQTSSYVTCPHSFNWRSRQQALRALPGRGGRTRGNSVNGLLGWSWASLRWVRAEWKQRSTSEVQLGLWRSFHRPQDRGLDSAQVVRQLSAGPCKIRMLPRFSGSLWNGNNRLHARDQINLTPDRKEEEEEVISAV